MKRVPAAVAVGSVLLAVFAWSSPPPGGLAFALKAVSLLALFWALGRLFLAPATRRRLVTTGVLVAVPTTLSLLAAEAVTRFYYRSLTTTSDFTSYFSERWRQTSLRTNAMGFREREFDPVPVEGTTRIAVIGDSFTYGQGIDEDERMTNLMERRLREAGLAVEVLNFGIPGAETEDHVRILEEHVLPIQPDVVLLQWLVNDMEGANKRERPKRHRLIPSDTIREILHKRSALYWILDRSWNQIQDRFDSGPSYFDYMDARFLDETSPDSLAADAALRRFIAILRERGIPMAMVVYPLLNGPAEDGTFSLGYLNDRVIAVCEEEGVAFVDLRETFVSVPPRELWVSSFDSHPGAFANELVTEAVLARLRADGLFGGEWKGELTRRSREP